MKQRRLDMDRNSLELSSWYCLHNISEAGNFGFSSLDYSRFKFGDDEVTRRFGTSLAQGFILQHLQGVTTRQRIVVCSSPYVFIPTAAHSLARHFLSYLNRWLAPKGLPTAQETRVHRTSTYQVDYSKLGAKDRLQLLQYDHLHIDQEFIRDKIILFIDDVRITGAHERMLQRMIEERKLTNRIYFIYFAGVVNDAIDPCIENNLNFHAVQTIFDLNSIIKNGQFSMNDRFVKYVLEYSHDAFRIFLQAQESKFVNTLLDMALGNGYHHVELYARNLETVHLQLSNNLS